MLNRFRQRYIGDKAFYKMVFAIVVPIIIQNTVANFVNLLDNVMVGRMGTEQMSGVSVANQLMFVFNLCIFGGLSGAGIFTAQYYGAKDHEGVRYTFRFKLYTALFVLAAAYIIFFCAAPQLIGLYLTEDASGDAAATLQYGLQYLHVMYFGMVPFALSQCYAGTLRETGETVVPMKASVVEVFLNLCLNYVLIFGKFGMPAMGVRGAALATVISRYAGLIILAVYTHRNHARHPFIKGAYTSPYIPKHLAVDIFKKGMPLLANEALWSLGSTTLVQKYSQRGLMVVAALNISSTISNMFNVMFMTMGNAVAILVGQALGANDPEKAKDYVRKLTAFSTMTCLVMGAVLIACSGLLPLLYNTTPDVRALATKFLITAACLMPAFSFANCFYFTLRSGGKTMITFVYDCVFSWLVMIPVAHVLVAYTGLPITVIYPICQGTEIIKAVIGYIMVKRGVWINNIVGAR
ncbi:MAG: MATE family efflux transporter [Eubacteriales bacterium]|nr:MATE family efflux transporter [Eubacteriales bacterium]